MSTQPQSVSYSRIVVGTDGTDSSFRAVHTAVSLAQAYGAELYIVCAYYGDSQQITTKSRSELYALPIFTEEDAQTIVAEAEKQARESGCEKVHTVVRSGGAASVLLHVVSQYDADLIVVGNRGLDTLLGRILGTIPGEVSRKASVDVMLVNTAQV